MRFTNHLLATASIAALLAGTACQSAHKTKVLPPSQANAPALNASSNGAAAGDANLRQLDAASATQTTDPAALLVESVEKEYQSGQASYKTGDEDAAREAYAQALDLLVATPLDVEADPRLRHELDQVLAAMRKLDLQEQQPDDAAAQKSEPAPIDEANEASAPVDAKVKAKAEAEVKVTHSDLPLMMTDPVAGYINYFSGRGRPILERALVRSGRYEEMIRQILAEEGVPQDLIYLAQAESGFHPLALSRAGARGMWQFMGSRAKGYGLERNRWVDERQDPQASTRAAAEHLKDLYHQFGDWYLAMAAYNSGPGAVTSAVKRTGYADFWELYRRNVLPRETKNYVPIILAMTIMAKNPAQYGLNDLVLDKPVPHDTVQIDYAVDLRLVAQCVDASPDALQDLNPSLLRWSTPPDEPFDLHLPAGTKEQYLSAIARIPQDMRIWWRYHKVDSGDTLASIARSYHITSKAIAEANNLDREASLAPDTRLVIPLKPNRRASEVRTYARGAIRYRVRRGDTVASVARNFNVPPTLVRRWNRLRGNSLYRRHILYIHLPVTPGTRPELASRAGSKSKPTKALLAQASGKGVVHHRVKRGETLSSIASTHHTTVTALTRDNGIHRRSTLHPGMILIIRPQ
jgi:membrane-bound lytic murein transglycosylase D